MKEDARPEQNEVDNERRAFLRNSVYAAYATPLITALLVAEESAAASRCSLEWCARRGFHPRCCRDF